MRWSTASEAARPDHNQDRVQVIPLTNSTVFSVADGAGGAAGSAAAARNVCEAVAERCRGDYPVNWASCLADIDEQMARSPGQAAAVVVEVGNDNAVTGASVGDCEAWIFGDLVTKNLTARQARDPLMGSGRCVPVSIADHLSGVLVVATDGLWKYMGRKSIAHTVTRYPLEVVVPLLIDSVKTRSGALQDDVSMVIVRP